MKGFIIPETKICVDYWNDPEEDYIRFLTHAHNNRLNGIEKVSGINIYVSDFTAWYLENVLQITNNNLVKLSSGDTFTLSSEVKDNEFSFDVTAIDANHCPGAMMYLFQGDFGTVLCTGDFRYIPSMLQNPVLKEVSEKKSLDIINLDNKFIGENCNFPSQAVAREQVIKLIRSFPEHRIELCVGVLGKIQLIKYIAEELKMPICVSDSCMAVVKKLEWEEFFTTDDSSTKLFANEIDIVDFKFVNLKRKEHGPVKFIMLTPIYFTSSKFGSKEYKKYRKNGIHIIPYSDHCNHEELVEFITLVRPSQIVPIFESYPDGHLNNKLAGINKNIIIPESITRLVQKKFDPSPQKSSDSSSMFVSCEELCAKKNNKDISRGSTSSTDIQIIPNESEPIQKALSFDKEGNTKGVFKTEGGIKCLEKNVLPLKSPEQKQIHDSLSSSDGELSTSTSEDEVNVLKRKFKKTVNVEPQQDLVDIETSSSDVETKCNEKAEIVKKRRRSLDKKMITINIDSSDTSLEYESFKSNHLKSLALDGKQRSVQNKSENRSIPLSDLQVVQNKDKDMNTDNVHKLNRNSSAHSTRHKKRKISKTVYDRNRKGTFTKEIQSVTGIEGLFDTSSVESVSVLDDALHITARTPNVIESESAEILVADDIKCYTTCFCSSNPLATEDKLNFWINKGVTNSIFKHENFVNSLKK